MTRDDRRAALTLHPDDDVAVALRDLAAGIELDVLRGDAAVHVVLKDSVPLGHKFALGPLAPGQRIRKYGQVIGRATERIDAGAHVHVHNLTSLRGRRAR
ncbi:MAG TPA: UxaA family hydrolase, partial [Casimicrobiaceae bacterium]|nr:UxaA family hydrolase [Casimicrobiaceae bacterium]